MVSRAMLGNRTMQDSFLYDRVEVVRGSMGLTTGAGDPSASINFVRKRPIAEKAGALNLKYGSWNDKRIEFDYGGALNESKTLKGRFVSTFGHGGSFMDRVKQRSNALYGVIEWSPGDKNFLTIGHRHQYQIVRGAPRKGASRYSKLTFGLDPNTGEVIEKWINAGNTPPSFNNGANWAFDKQKTENSFIEYKHFFSPDFSLQASYNRTHYKDHFLYGDIGTLTYTPEYNAATYTWGREKHSFTGQALDIFLDGKFKLFHQEQQIIAGISGERSTVRGLYYPEESALPDLDIDNIRPEAIAWNGRPYVNHNYLVRAMPLDYWNNGDFPMMAWPKLAYVALVGPEDTISGGIKSTVRQFGPYFALKLKPHKRITAVLGGRWLNWKIRGGKEWFDPTKRPYRKREDFQNSDVNDIYELDIGTHSLRKFVPYGGLIVDITPSLTAYASYTGIVKLQDALQDGYGGYRKDGGEPPPITGNSKEVGLKGGLWNDRLNFSLAYFTMTQKGYPSFEAEWIDEAKLGYDFGRGYKNSGYYINIAGKITPKWLVNAGFTKLKMGRPFEDQPASANDMGADLNLDCGCATHPTLAERPSENAAGSLGCKPNIGGLLGYRGLDPIYLG
jgi:putative tonB-dependent receptor